MAKQGRGRKAENTNYTTNTNNNGSSNLGKGNVTPIEVATIVERYLADNNFSKARSAFRSEASSLLAINEVPKTLLSLEVILDEYIRLKEQKVGIEQEKCILDSERCRIDALLQGMQDVLTAYNSNSLSPPQPHPPPPANIISSANGYPPTRTPVMTSVSMTHGVKLDQTTLSTPIIGSRPTRKRRNYKDLQEAHQVSKKYCGPSPNNHLSTTGTTNSVPQLNNIPTTNGENTTTHQPPQLLKSSSSSPNFAHGGSPIQGSNVAKNLFNNKPSTSNSSGPKTPPRAASSQSEKSVSPLEDISSTAKSHHNNTTTNSQENTPTNCTIISSKTIIVSPAKKISIERNHCSFSSPAKSNLKRQTKRENVKGRLDFDGSDVPICLENGSGGDGSSTSESEKEGDVFDLDFPNFDAFGPDFSLTELLTDFGIECGTLDYSCPTTTTTTTTTTTAGASTDADQESPPETNNGELAASHDLLEHSSAMTEVLTGDMSINAAVDSVTSVKSITKCITILSPTKSSRNTFMITET